MNPDEAPADPVLPAEPQPDVVDADAALLEATPPPTALQLSLSAVVSLGIEHWRLSAWLGGAAARAPGAATARHALRKIGDVLAVCELEVRSLDGHPFDPGLAAEVVHAEDDPALPEGQSVVAETVSPMVLWRGRVVRPAEVVTRRGTMT